MATRMRRPPPRAAAATSAPTLRWEQVERRVMEDPLFQVLTFDGIEWIDPFTGKPVNAPFDWKETALTHLRENATWRGGTVKSIQELHAVRWRHYLAHHLQAQAGLRLVGPSRRWIDPLTGRLSAVVITEAGIDNECLARMSAVLAELPGKSPKDLISNERLMSIQQDLLGKEQRQDAQDTGLLPEVRVSAGLAQRSPSSETSLTSVQVSGRSSGHGRSPTSESFAPLEPAGGTGTTRRRTTSEHLAVVDGDPTPIDAQRARDVQRRLLGILPAVPGFEHALLYQPYEHIGGDFYELRRLDDDRFLLLLGDVAGHGTQAALVVASLIKTARFIAGQGRVTGVADFLCKFNDLIRDDLVQGQFLTCFAAVLTPDAATMECVCAGHHEAVIGNVSEEVILRRVGGKGMVVGMSKGRGFAASLRPETVIFKPGDTVMLFTDGLSECANARGVQLGEWSTFGAFTCHLARSPSEILDRIKRQVDQFTGGKLDDDLTILILRYVGGRDKAQA